MTVNLTEADVRTTTAHRLRRHRYFGVVAPNSLLRTAVAALKLAATTSSPAPKAQPAAEPAHRRVARYAWLSLLRGQ